MNQIRSSFILRTTYPPSSVTPPLAGPSGRHPPGMWRSRSRPPAVVVHLAGGPHTRHGAGGGNLQRSVSATRATSTLAYSNPSPSSHGSEMVKSDRRGLILTKPNKNKIVHRQTWRLTGSIFAYHILYSNTPKNESTPRSSEKSVIRLKFVRVPLIL